MSWVDILGVILSALSGLMLVGLIVHSLRRRPVGRAWPGGSSPRARAGRNASVRRVLTRLAWPAILLTSFLVGLNGVPLRHVVHSGAPDGGSGVTRLRDGLERPVDQRRYTVRAPFYLRQRTDEQGPGGGWTTTERSSVLQLPWLFLGTSIAYVAFCAWSWRAGTRRG